MIPFNYHHLYYFYSIARLGSVTRASEELRLGQPALSSQLKQFEDFLGVKLFTREGKKMVLTDEGQYVLSYASDIFDAGREFMDGLKDLSQKAGRLQIQIGLTPSVSKAYIAALLEFMLSKQPNVFFSVRKENIETLLDDLRAHRLDLLLTDRPHRSIHHDEIENHLVGRAPIAFCASPSLAKKYRHFPKDLDGAPMILPTSHSQVYHAVQEFLLASKISPYIVGEIQDIELVLRLAQTGRGIAPLSRFMIENTPSKIPLVILEKSSQHKIFDALYVLTKKRKKTHPLVPAIVQGFRLPAF